MLDVRNLRHGFRLLTCVLLTILVGIHFNSHVHSFNINTNNFQKISNPFRQGLFGYTLKFHAYEGQTGLLIGIPRMLGEEDHPGSLVYCKLGNQSEYQEELCFELNVTSSTDGMDQYRRNQLMGTSLARNPKTGDIAVCDPGYLRKLKSGDGKEHLFYIGACYLIHPDLNTDHIQILKVLDDPWKMSKYAYGQAGISTVFTQDGETLLIGAPGLLNWKGGFISYTLRTNVSHVIMPGIDIGGQTYSYTGFSVGSGAFEKGSTSLVIGSPRSDGVGAVFIVQGVFKVKVKLTSTRIGSGFGSCVLVMDINLDGLDDLLVSAPWYFEENQLSEGRVYVYVSNGYHFPRSASQVLSGSHVSGALFGSSIANLGDINSDGFNDVAIGAPYEDDGRGALYVFNGCHDGVHTQPSQHIKALTVDVGLRSFGFAIDGNTDLNGDGYPDLAVSSPVSNHVIIFYSKPVAYVECKINIGKSLIDLMRFDCDYGGLGTCSKFNVTCSVRGHRLPDLIDIVYTVTADVSKSNVSTRGLIVTGPSSFAKTITRNVTLNTNDSGILHQYTIKYQSVEKNTDMDSEFLVNVDYGRIEEEKITLDRFYPRNFTAAVIFGHGCGPDHNCVEDLRTQTQIYTSLYTINEEKRKSPFLSFGSKGLIAVHINIENRGETSYDTGVLIHSEYLLTFIKTNQSTSGFTCSPLVTDFDRGKTVSCRLMTPLGHHESFSADVWFRVDDWLNESSNLSYTNITTEYATRNHLAGKIMDVIPIEIGLHGTIQLFGQSFPSTVFVQDPFYNVDDQTRHVGHSYAVKNEGPGTLRNISIDIAAPNSAGVFVEISKMQIPEVYKRKVFCNLMRHHLPRQDKFAMHRCTIESIKPYEIIDFRLDLNLSLETKHADQLTTVFSSNATIEYTTYLGKASETALVSTDVMASITPPPRAQFPFYLLGIIMGWAILAIIIMLLKKIGFFRRRRLADFQRLLQDNAENEHREAGDDATFHTNNSMLPALGADNNIECKTLIPTIPVSDYLEPIAYTPVLADPETPHRIHTETNHSNMETRVHKQYSNESLNDTTRREGNFHDVQIHAAEVLPHGIPHEETQPFCDTKRTE